MESPKHELHIAMRMVLLEQPQYTASTRFVADETVRRDLYRRKKDGEHVEAWQIRLRAVSPAGKARFVMVDDDTVRLTADFAKSA